MTHVVGMIPNGVFEKYPDLYFVFIECGVSWVPSLMWRLDANFKALRKETPVLDAFTEVAAVGATEVDRLARAKGQMERRLRNRRKNLGLLALIELVLARPAVSAGLIAVEFKVSQRAALDLVAELAVREVTGRGRYRAWGIL